LPTVISEPRQSFRTYTVFEGVPKAVTNKFQLLSVDVRATYYGPMLKKALLVTLSLLGLLISPISLTTSSAHAATTFCGSSFSYPNGCKLGQDSSGQYINPITTCHNYDSIINGDITNPGSDWILNVVEEDVGSNATVSAPYSGKVAITINLDCRGWIAYQFSGSLVAADGTRYPITFNAGTLRNQDNTYDTSDYCFIKQLTSNCKWLDIEGSYNIPSSAPSGVYSIALHSVSLPVAAGITDPLLPPAKDFLYKSTLTVNSNTPAATPSPTPTTSQAAESAVSPTFTLSYLSGTITVHFASGDVANFLNQNPSGQAVLRVTNSGGASITGTPFTFKQGEATTSITNVTAGIWSVQSAGINASGQGPWSSPQLISAIDPVATPSPVVTSSSGSIVKKVITWKCAKGKITTTLKGTKAVCPKGYTLKK